jgi:hypothetical protein
MVWEAVGIWGDWGRDAIYRVFVVVVRFVGGAWFVVEMRGFLL